MDFESGRILSQNNIKEKKLIASITKVMTAIIVLENCDIEKKIMVGEEILPMYGTNIYIEIGEEITIKDLLYGLLLRSGNDAAITLAVNTLGEEIFVQKMNQKAIELGMKDTTFENPHGLDDDTKNISTAYDMALLAKYAFQNATYKEIISTKKYKTKTNKKSYLWINRMSLLTNYKYCIGGKNGYTPRAGKTLISYATKNNKTFIIVSLNDPSIYENHKKLYERYFSLYDNYTIIDKNNFTLNDPSSGKKYYIKESFSYPLLKSEIKNISTLVRIIDSNKKKNTGEIKIYLGENEIGKIKIYKKDKKKKDSKSIFQKVIDLFRRKSKKINRGSTKQTNRRLIGSQSTGNI